MLLRCEAALFSKVICMHFPKRLPLSETLLKAFYRQGRTKSISYFGKHLVKYFLRSDRLFYSTWRPKWPTSSDVDLLELLLSLAF